MRPQPFEVSISYAIEKYGHRYRCGARLRSAARRSLYVAFIGSGLPVFLDWNPYLTYGRCSGNYCGNSDQIASHIYCALVQPVAAEGTSMALKPVDITRHQFSRRLLGGLDPEEVRTFLADVAANLDRTMIDLVDARTQRASLEQALKEATATAADVAKKLAVAEQARSNAETRIAEIREELAVTRHSPRATTPPWRRCCSQSR